jgi:hypothetical protein
LTLEQRQLSLAMQSLIDYSSNIFSGFQELLGHGLENQI